MPQTISRLPFLTGSAFVICLLVALALGALVAAVYMYKNTYTQSMAVTLALLPAMVQVIILLVNGNLGAGVADVYKRQTLHSSLYKYGYGVGRWLDHCRTTAPFHKQKKQ